MKPVGFGALLPHEINENSWTDMVSDAYPDSVRFYFEKDIVQKIEWLYCLD
jgi:hypothetical protein